MALAAPVTVLGTVKVGATVICSAPFQNATRVTYAWLRDGKAISGATAGTYGATASDFRRLIACRATGTNTVSAKTGTSKAARVASAGTVTALRAPTITGKAAAGKRLTSHVGNWTPVATTYTYQWLRDGKPIKNATHRSYKVVKKDRGHRIAVRVKAHRAGFVDGLRHSRSHAVKR